ncbi:hypothetical protein MMC29_001182 [Sticta canariensis]|nr:hypothetical protein [Sticta canariensis]
MAAHSPQAAGGLMEQGSIDWVALSKTSVSFSLEVLARFARAGVETLTIAVGQAIFSQFDVPADAQQRLELSVSKLKAFSSAANALWFGIGFKHLIRTMLETEQGAAFVAVSSCLMVSYDQNFSATVLKTLCDKSSMPEKLSPSLPQWGTFINMCTTAVTSSRFPLLIEGFSKLLVSSATRSEPRRLAATSPGELASALLELAHLSTGKVANITLAGNGDCAWLAALAEWLFSLKVEIIDQTENLLYQSKGEGRFNTHEFFQLTIIRLEDGQNCVPQSLLRSRTHLVPPGQLLFDLRTETSYHKFYQGRSEWSTILTETFSVSFQRLLEPEIIPLFSQVLYSGLDVQSFANNLARMNPWGDYLFTSNSTQHRRRFSAMLLFAAARLPELAALEKYDRDHSSELDSFGLDRENYSPTGRTAGRSKKGIKDQLIMAGFSTALIDACSCDDCNVIDKTLPSQVNSLIPDCFCLSKTAIAIFEFIWYLSWLDMDDTIRPSSTGLMNLYSKNSSEISRADLIRAKPIDYEVFDAFEEVITLLTGFEATDQKMPKKHSALAMHGLCVYRPSLAHPSICVEGQLRLRVVPGQIDWNDKLYDRVDEKRNQSPFDQLHYNPTETTELIDMLGANPLLQLTVKETLVATSLSVQLVVSPETGSPVHWNSKFPSSCLISAPIQLLGHIKTSLRANIGRKTHKPIDTGPVWTPTSSIKPWSGRCSIIELPWWTHDTVVHGQLLSILRPNDWIIAVRDSKNPNKLKIFCGSFALLYSILSNLFTRAECPKFICAESPRLIQSGDCLICSMPGFGTVVWQEISVQSSVAGQVQTLDFRIRTDRVCQPEDSYLNQTEASAQLK